MLQNHRWQDSTYANNDYINVINSTKKRNRIENSKQAEKKTHKLL